VLKKRCRRLPAEGLGMSQSQQSPMIGGFRGLTKTILAVSFSGMILDSLQPSADCRMVASIKFA